jgi:UDP-N-acetylglucosamine/UDP-N-acetylgalactosamine 4-epimerase
MTACEDIQICLSQAPKTWLVISVPGFIGSNLLEKRLELDQRVIGLDNFATGGETNRDICFASMPW